MSNGSPKNVAGNDVKKEKEEREHDDEMLIFGSRRLMIKRDEVSEESFIERDLTAASRDKNH